MEFPKVVRTKTLLGSPSSSEELGHSKENISTMYGISSIMFLLPKKKYNQDDMASLMHESDLGDAPFPAKNLRDKDLAQVKELLRKSSVLQELGLDHNKLTLADGGLAESLARNRTLKILWLEENRIGDAGAMKLADALRENATLEKISLWFNEIGDAGAKRLAKALETNRALKEISLDSNRIGDDGARALAHALRCNASIRKLTVYGNPISGDLLRQIYEICGDPKRRTSSTTLPSEREDAHSLFFGKLMGLQSDRRNIENALEDVASSIRDVHMMKFYYTAVSSLHRSGILAKHEASHHIQNGLDKSVETCACEDALVLFKLVLEKAELDGHMRRADFIRYENRAQVKRMENAPFVRDIVTAIKSNAARIEGLEANVQAIDRSVGKLKNGLKHKMRVEGAIGYLSAVINVVSFGVGGEFLSAMASTFLEYVVDFGDYSHLEAVAKQLGDERFLKQVEFGMDMATSGYGDRLLRDAVEEGNTVAILSATAFMMQEANTPTLGIGDDDEDVLDSRQEETNEGNEVCSTYNDMEKWLLTYLPHLKKEDLFNYCRCLEMNGFDSVDVLKFLRTDDLHFMKEGHRRALMEQITKDHQSS